MTAEVVSALRNIVGPAGVLTGDDIGARHYIDARAPAGSPPPKLPMAVVRPRNTEEVSRVLAYCHSVKQPVVTQGGMSGLVRGALPSAAEIGLSTELMNKIEEIDTRSGTATVQSGTILQTLQERVAEDGYMFPLDLGGRGSATIGGNISTNAGGNRVIRYGMTRELVLGIEAVTADGRIHNGLHKFIKNNTGYDLKHLFIGSEGTLGVVTRAVLKIFPVASDRPVALCALRSFEDATELLKSARKALGGELTAFELMWNAFYKGVVEQVVKMTSPPLPTHYPFYVLIEATSGDAERSRALLSSFLEKALEDDLIVDATVADSIAATRAIWSIRDSTADLGKVFGQRVSCDVSLTIAEMNNFCIHLEKAARAVDDQSKLIAYGHLGDGNLHVIVPHSPNEGQAKKMEELVYKMIGDFKGSISAEHGIGTKRKAYLHYTRTPDEIETMKTIKRALDPHNILNRGRVFEL